MFSLLDDENKNCVRWCFPPSFAENLTLRQGLYEQLTPTVWAASLTELRYVFGGPPPVGEGGGSVTHRCSSVRPPVADTPRRRGSGPRPNRSQTAAHRCVRSRRYWSDTGVPLRHRSQVRSGQTRAVHYGTGQVSWVAGHSDTDLTMPFICPVIPTSFPPLHPPCSLPPFRRSVSSPSGCRCRWYTRTVRSGLSGRACSGRGTEESSSTGPQSGRASRTRRGFSEPPAAYTRPPSTSRPKMAWRRRADGHCTAGRFRITLFF